MKKVAVISDATSPEYFFPQWLKYYGNMFGTENLYLITYLGLKSRFADYNLGYVWELNSIYNDNVRARVISSSVQALLEVYDVVVRCDIDEFLIPNLDRHSNLRAYIEQLERPFVTALGVDVVEGINEPELQMDEEILVKQRKFAVRSSALNKTSIRKIPMRWAEGFHSASVYPSFSDLFNFHLKFSDVKRRVEWFALMEKSVDPSSQEAEYFANGHEKLVTHQQWCATLPSASKSSLLEVIDFDHHFLASVVYNPLNQISQGDFTTLPFLFEIPQNLTGVI